MKIYTKTGDKGQTGLIGGTRISKDDQRLEAYGTVDELNSNIGFLISLGVDQKTEHFLESIQNDLFVIGSYLATDQEKKSTEEFLIEEGKITAMEQEIDRMNAVMPELDSFILPGGSKSASFSHICRTISRRAERNIIFLTKNYNIDIQLLKYINRLSDYLFTLARYLNFSEGIAEKSWKL